MMLDVKKIIEAATKAADDLENDTQDEAVRAALTAAQAEWERQGWKLVPVEPTQDMRAAAEFVAMESVAEALRRSVRAAPMGAIPQRTVWHYP